MSANARSRLSGLNATAVTVLSGTAIGGKRRPAARSRRLTASADPQASRRLSGLNAAAVKPVAASRSRQPSARGSSRCHRARRSSGSAVASSRPAGSKATGGGGGRGQEDEVLALIERPLDRLPECGVHRERRLVPEHPQGAQPVPRPRETLQARLDRGCQLGIGCVAVREERLVEHDRGASHPPICMKLTRLPKFPWVSMCSAGLSWRTFKISASRAASGSGPARSGRSG